MKQFWFQVVGLLIVIFVALALSQNQNFSRFIQPQIPAENEQEQQPAFLTRIRILDGAFTNPIVVKKQLDIELADTKDKRTKGLGGRDSLASDSGMLFIFEKPEIPRFWMKGMKIPIDIIWVNGDRIVDLLPNVQPADPLAPDQSLPLYSPTTAVDKVLEVNAGVIQTYNIRVGDRMVILEPSPSPSLSP